MKKYLLTLASLAALQAQAAITVKDDDGKAVTVQKPAQRVVSLAPHVTEMLFAAGGGDKIVGAVTYSDYPEAAKKIPRVGDNRQVDMERLIALKPDLLVVWRHGSSERQIDMLRQLNIPIFHSEPQTLDAIPEGLIRLGQLMGTESAAQPAAAEMKRKLAALRAQYAGRPPVRTFYQVWDKPLYTLNGSHIVSDALRVCGGENIFASMKITAPVVSVEGVLQEDPEAIFGTAEKDYGGVNLWRQYGTLKATRQGNLFTVEGDLLNRAGPRMIQGTAILCEKLELARQHRKH
ncbi:cobalamin-binding protein [Pseudoduganella violacea]|uniref:Iron complex transport system substrate-binding protein n=1 Tax=Pseudoduganella violacea TaxID=1715466 RepID=A0A7W5BG08_9BURK|nr:cobalamin-binding protein [Pseudoduganella violacea]MBB3122443.1 iron complex transport system substrate-binding protein [Pseudoduganella violacea]